MKPKIYTIYAYSLDQAQLAYAVRYFREKGYRCELQHCSATGEYRMAVVIKTFTKVGALFDAKILGGVIKIMDWVEHHSI